MNNWPNDKDDVEEEEEEEKEKVDDDDKYVDPDEPDTDICPMCGSAIKPSKIYCKICEKIK